MSKQERTPENSQGSSHIQSYRSKRLRGIGTGLSVLSGFFFSLILVASPAGNAAGGGQAASGKTSTAHLASLPSNSPTVQNNSSVAPSSATKSFKEWRDQKIHEIQTRVDLVQARIDSQLPTDTNLGQLQTQLKNDTYSLEMAKELTVSDYFVAYLTKVENKRETYKEIAAKMSHDEVADLMSAYINSIFSAQSPSSSTSSPQGHNLSVDNIK